jgi:hypothetical protein
MPSFELPIRSLSILFIFGALIAILWFPDNPHTPALSRALFWWFLALGVVRWVEAGIIRLVSDNEGKVKTGVWYLISVPALVAQVVFLVFGILSFVSVLSNL